MPSTYTDNDGLELQATGENENTWGIRLNTVIEILDSWWDPTTITATSGTTTLSIPDGTTTGGDGRALYIKITSTLTGNLTIEAPEDKQRLYFVKAPPDLDGNTCTFKTENGTGVNLDQAGVVYLLLNNGTNTETVTVFADRDDLGEAAFANTGTASSEVPLNSDLGSAAYSAESALLNRSNHTGTQPLSTISDAGTAASFDRGTGSNQIPTNSQIDFTADFSQSLGTNGWCELPNGLILQWGKRGTSSGNVSFPRTFPNVCLNVTGTSYNNSGSSSRDSGLGLNANSISTTGFSFTTNSNFNGIFWQAIGR